MRLTLIVNPAAGSAEDGSPVQTAREALTAAGHRVDVRETAGQGDAERLSREAVALGADVIVAAGGDGTLNEVVNGVASVDDALSRCAIGLHATLTAPFRPLTMYFRPLDGGLFLPFPAMLRSGLLRRLDPGLIEDELLAQLAAFKELFGRAPDFVDGHQHAQLFPQVRDAFLRAVKEAAPGAWVRQGGRAKPLAKLLGAPKALVLDVLSARFRNRAAVAGIPFNAAFAGAYDFSKAPDFAVLMGEFLNGLPDGGLVM
jgi:hypothetical protein